MIRLVLVDAVVFVVTGTIASTLFTWILRGATDLIWTLSFFVACLAVIAYTRDAMRRRRHIS